MSTGRIAIISPFQLRLSRGVERANWALATEFSRQGNVVDLFVWSSPEGVHWGETPVGVRIREVPASRYFMAHWATLFYRWWLARGHYDWVIVTFAGYGESRALHFSPSSKVCVVLQYPREQVPHRYTEFKSTGLAQRADLVVGVSQHTALGAQAYFGRSCHVIPNGVDTGVFEPSRVLRDQVRQRLRLSPEARVVITLAALEERKGIQHVIRAIARLSETFPDLHYWILGEGAYRPQLEQLIVDLGVCNHVHLEGAVDDVVPYLSMADVGCLISYGEAFGIALVEYMAMELPCIASQHPPFNEIVKPEYGVLIDERHPDALIEVLHNLLLNEEVRHNMGQAGRKKAIEQYSWRRVSEMYLSLLWKEGSN